MLTFLCHRFIYEGIKLSDEEAEVVGPGAKKKKKHAEREKSELNPKEIKDHFRQVGSLGKGALSQVLQALNS
jgi:hypothetical protein